MSYKILLVSILFSLSANSFSESDNLNLHYSKNIYSFWIKYFSTREKARFQRHLKNADSVRDVVKKVFKEEGVPFDLFYVGLIESGYNAKIRSHASAVGPWQFIKGTGKRYGLKINSALDERRNIYKATRAAAGYFKDLYNIFGSWELALCAYNAGEYRIINAIRKGDTRDYRVLAKRGLIPKETIYYVPKVAAAKELYNNRAKYKLNRKLGSSKKLNKGKSFKLYRSFSPRKLASKLGLSYSNFTLLNPDFKKGWVKVNKSRGLRIFYFGAVGKRYVKSIKKSAALSSKKYARRRKHYRVRRGDSLSRIAKKFRTTVGKLVALNGLKTSKIIHGQRIRIPGRG